MARFVFKLEPLLKARSRVEQQFQLAVAQIERERIRLEDKLRAKQTSLTGGKEELRDQLSGLIDVRSLRYRANMAQQIMRDAQKLVLELAGVHNRLFVAREKLIEAARSRRAIELVREKRYQQYKADEAKAEIAAMDELAVIAAARKEPIL